MPTIATDSRQWHTSACRKGGARSWNKPNYVHTSWPARSCNPHPRRSPGHALQKNHNGTPGSAEHRPCDIRPAALPHASTVALAFFIALLMAAFFITLPAFFAFFVAFIAPPFMAAFFMAPAFFIAAALFIAAMTRSWCNEAGCWKGSGLGALEPPC